MRAYLSRAFEWLVGTHRFTDEDEQARARFLVWMFPIGVAMTVISTIAYPLVGTTADMLGRVAGIGLVFGAVALWRQTASFIAMAHLLCTTHTAIWALSTFETHDVTALAWLSFGPLLAYFLAGVRTGTLWLVVTIALTAVLVGIIATDPKPLPTPTGSSITRIAILIPVVAVVGLMTQLSRQRAMRRLAEARERAESANQAKSRFLASISHEIRTPLNGILGTCELALLGELPAEAREHLCVVQDSGATLMALINDLLDISKAEAGRLTMAPHAFSPLLLVTEVTALHRARALSVGSELVCTTDVSAQLTLWADSVRLRQVLHNLVGNALKFGKGAPVEVVCAATQVEGGYRLSMSVADRGRGMTPADVDRLFRPFSQLRATDALYGSGLGLAISHVLVSQMGGALTVHSAAGQGSTFSVTIELPEAPKPSELPRVSATGALGHLRGERVLVVDDNAINLRVAVGMVQKLGLIAEVANSGEAALEMLSRKKFDLVLMDLQMPDIDGAEATRRLRAREGSTRRTPVIALTASALASELEGCRAAGMDECLTKPLQLARLREVLEAQLGTVSVGGLGLRQRLFPQSTGVFQILGRLPSVGQLFERVTQAQELSV